jgi:uncharacterized membrane protein YfcA
MMIPGSISGTLGNVRRGNIDVRAAVIVGLAACVCVPFSSILATLLDPLLANVLFSLYILFLVGQMLVRKLRGRAK